MKYSAASKTMLAVVALACSRDQRPIESLDNHFRWTGRIPAGQMVHVRNLNGNITVEGTSGNDVIVTGTKRWRSSDPAGVRFAVDPTGGAICALWDTRTSCNPRSYKPNVQAARASDVAVDFIVQVPRGIGADIRTIDADVVTRNMSAPVTAMTARGSIDAATDVGPVNAEAVTGQVNARLGSLGASGDVRLSVLSGSVRLELPATADATVSASSTRGVFRSESPIATVDSAGTNRFWTVKLGSGARKVILATVSGDIELKTK